jgi:hypothetical protein
MPSQITPTYANIKVPNTSPAAAVTTRKTRTLRIKDEIKFLYKKKEKLNRELYNIHLKVAQEWGNTWHIIQEYILGSINREMQQKYKILEEKLTLKQSKKTQNQHTILP